MNATIFCPDCGKVRRESTPSGRVFSMTKVCDGCLATRRARLWVKDHMAVGGQSCVGDELSDEGGGNKAILRERLPNSSGRRVIRKSTPMS